MADAIAAERLVMQAERCILVSDRDKCPSLARQSSVSDESPHVLVAATDKFELQVSKLQDV
jgi:hypothetical protein